MNGSDSIEATLRHVAEHREDFLEELFTFLAIPSVSTQPAHAGDVQEAATWLAHSLETAGLEHVEVIETERHPLVYADWLHAGSDKPTILIYGHYDVQPVEPEEAWQSPPFSPEIRDDFIYARGASDDKGQLFIHVKAVASYLQVCDALPLNVKFLIEGEEEIGGTSINRYVRENAEKLRADVAVVSDTAMFAPAQPTLVYGLRGLVSILMDIVGPDHDLHSGTYGGGIDNPINVLCHIIAQLKDEAGHVNIPGFYDDVRPLSADERAVLARFPLDEEQWLAATGAPAVWGERDFSLVERLGARPTLDVNGIVGGYTGEGGKTIIPARAHAKVSLRLVPDQKPEKVASAFRDYVRRLLPPTVTADIRWTGGAPATITDYGIPAVRAAIAALEHVFGNQPILQRGGGSIPVVGDFQKYLGLQTVLMGFGLPGDRIHSPNERFYLPNFYHGIETAIHFMNAYAEGGSD